jgi:DNA-binding CsgD family transcriptional regulator
MWNAANNSVAELARILTTIVKSNTILRDKNAENTVDILEPLVNFLPGCAFAKDLNGNYLIGNDYLVKNIAGLNSSRDLIGNNDRYLSESIGKRWPDDFYKSITNDDRTVMIDGNIQIDKKEPPFIDNNGRVVVQLSTKIPLRDETGSVIGLFGISLDNSNSINILEMHRYYRTLYHDKKASTYQFLKHFADSENIGNLAKLSFREVDCMVYLAHGKTIKEIGRYLDLSPRTVEGYLDNIKDKLELNTKGDITTYFWSFRRHV